MPDKKLTPMMEFIDNLEEQKAIKKLEAAFKLCAKVGIKFSVMDNTLIYANKRLYEECLKIEESESNKSFNGSYPTVAYAQNTELRICPSVNCHKAMGSCGGW